MWPTNYLTTVYVLEKVGGIQEGCQCMLGISVINIFMKLRQIYGKKTQIGAKNITATGIIVLVSYCLSVNYRVKYEIYKGFERGDKEFNREVFYF